MDKMRATIIFSVPRQPQWKPLSLLIRWLQYPKSLKPFDFFGLYHSSHCAILIDGIVFESIFFLGTRKIPLQKWRKLNIIKRHKEIPLTEDQYHDGLLYLNASLGISYAFLELWGILLGKIMKTFFKKELYGNPFVSVKPKMKCSELCYSFLIVIKRITGLKNPDLVEPRDIEFLV
jgi:hypothetical protein